MFENPMSFIRSIKGAPASVLLALAFVGRAMRSGELQMWTGYKDDNIHDALRFLEQLGWVVSHSPRGPWALAEGRQLPLMALLDDSDLIGLPSSSSSFLNSESEEKIEQEEQTTPIKSDSLDCLLAAGVREPKASRLARLPHVTPEFIQAHIQQARKQGHSIGTAIYRIENGWTVEIPKNDDDDRRKYIEGEYAEFIEH